MADESPTTDRDEKGVPPPAQPGRSEGVKFSDLNAIRQQMLTRASMTLTGIGLTAVAAGAIGQLLPHFCHYPVLVYIAAIVLPLTALGATAPLHDSPELQTALLERLSLEAGHVDAVSPEFQKLFVKDIRCNTTRLNEAKEFLVSGAGLLVAHVYLVILSLNLAPADAALLQSLGFSGLSADAAIYYGGAIVLVMVEVFRWWRRRRQANIPKIGGAEAPATGTLH